MVLCRGATGVGQPIPGNSIHLHFYSRTLQRLPLRKEKDLWRFYSNYGPSPRSLFLFAHNTTHYEYCLNMEIGNLSPDSLIELLQDPNAAIEDIHFVITTGPLPGDRSKPYRTFTSPGVIGEYCKSLFEDEVDVLRRHYDALCGHPTTFNAAGMVFEHCVHQFLRKKKTITLFPILGRILTKGENSGDGIIYDNYTTTKNAKGQKQVKLPELEEFIIIDESETGVKYGTYYRPKRRNFPSINSWVLIRRGHLKGPVFIMFQITINATEHDVKQEGLDLMDRLDIPQNASRWLVVLTPRGVNPKIGPVMANYLKKKIPANVSLNPKVRFRVFHYPIDIFAASPDPAPQDPRSGGQAMVNAQ